MTKNIECWTPHLRDGFLLIGDDRRVAHWVNAQINGGDGSDADGTDYHAVGILGSDGELVAGVVFQWMRQLWPVSPFDDHVEIDDDGFCRCEDGSWRIPFIDVEIAVACADFRTARPAVFKSFFEYCFVESGYGHITAECDDRNHRVIRNLRMLGFRRIGEKAKPPWAGKSGGDTVNLYGLIPQWISAYVVKPEDVRRMIEKMTSSKKSAAPVKDNASANTTTDLAQRNRRRAEEQERRTGAAAAGDDAGALGGAASAAPSGTSGADSLG